MASLESRLILKAESDVIFWGVFGNKKKATESFDSIALVPLTELFSNNFMDDLEKIWKLRAFIPDPTTPPMLYRPTDTEDVD